MTEPSDKPKGILSREVNLPGWAAALIGVNRKAEDLSELDAQGLRRARRRYTVTQVIALVGAGATVLQGYSATLSGRVALAVAFFFIATVAVLLVLYSAVVKKLIEIALLIRQGGKRDED